MEAIKKVRFSFKEFKELLFEKCLWVIGGYENQMSDYGEGSVEYDYAKEAIKNLDNIILEAVDELECDLSAEISDEITKIMIPEMKRLLKEEGYNG